MREFSDYDDTKSVALSDKPAMNTLKKTFTAMLSKIGSSRMMGGTGDTSSDNISVNSRYRVLQIKDLLVQLPHDILSTEVIGFSQ